MKKSTHYIALAYFLVFNLVFNQVALNFFHSRHDAHEVLAKLQKKGNDEFHKHGEHCRVCSIEILFNLFFEPAFQLSASQQESAELVLPDAEVDLQTISFTQDRAPPVLS